MPKVEKRQKGRGVKEEAPASAKRRPPQGGNQAHSQKKKDKEQGRNGKAEKKDRRGKGAMI